MLRDEPSSATATLGLIAALTLTRTALNRVYHCTTLRHVGPPSPRPWVSTGWRGDPHNLTVFAV